MGTGIPGNGIAVGIPWEWELISGCGGNGIGNWNHYMGM